MDSTHGSIQPSAGRVIEDIPDDKPMDLIVLMGATGSGKSTFVNLLSNSSIAAVGHDSESTTHDMQQITLGMDGRHVCIIDSPGFDDTYQDDYDILKKISEWLTVTYKSGIHVTGIIYLREITESRMRGSTLKNFTMFTKLCGTETLSNVLFVTTKWDICPGAMAESRQAEMETKFLKNELELGAKLVRHDNTIQSACSIIRGLLGNPPVVLNIQKQLVDDDKKLGETDAGEEMNAELTKERKKWAKEYADGLAAVENAHNDKLKRMLEDSNAKFKEELDRIDRQKKALKDESEQARKQRVGAMEQLVVDRANNNGQTPAAFLKDLFTTLAPVIVPAAIGAWSEHTKHQKEMQRVADQNVLQIAQVHAESQRRAEASQRQAEASQRQAEAAQMQMMQSIKDELSSPKQAHTQPPVVLGGLAGLFHLLRL